MKKVNKEVATNAVLRKESKTFDGWFKYEITIKDSNGNERLVPAYGKDLQDALSRVVHDKKAKKIGFVLEKVPSWVWAILWLGTFVSVTTYYVEHSKEIGDMVGLMYVGTCALMVSITVSINNWFKLKNRAK